MKPIIKSQLNDMLNATVLRKFGKYTVERISENEVCVTDGWRADFVILYDFGGWAHDGIFAFRKDIRKYLDKLSPSIFKS
jgi:hypothetical protein